MIVTRMPALSRRPGHTPYRWQFVTSAARACPQALAGGGPGDSLGRVAILILPGTRRPFSSEPIIRSGTGSAAVVLQHAPVPMQPILKPHYISALSIASNAQSWQ